MTSDFGVLLGLFVAAVLGGLLGSLRQRSARRFWLAIGLLVGGGTLAFGLLGYFADPDNRNNPFAMASLLFGLPVIVASLVARLLPAAARVAVAITSAVSYLVATVAVLIVSVAYGLLVP